MPDYYRPPYPGMGDTETKTTVLMENPEEKDQSKTFWEGLHPFQRLAAYKNPQFGEMLYRMSPAPKEFARNVEDRLGLAPNSINTMQDLSIATEHYMAFAPTAAGKWEPKTKEDYEWAQKIGKEATAPKTRDIQQGDEVVTQEWDATTSTWKEVGRGKKWNPKEPKLNPPPNVPGYHPPAPTSKGYMVYNTLTGKWEPMLDDSGQPLMPPVADTGLAGKKATETETAKKEADRIAALKSTMPKTRNRVTNLERQWDNVDQTIDKALGQIGSFTAGLGAWTKIVPATTAKDLSENLNTIRANIGFDKLQEMRQNSPTGGALGQVSDLENKLLQAVQGSLEQSQSPKQLSDNLKTVKTMLSELKKSTKAAFDMDYKEVKEGSIPESAAPPEGLKEEDIQYNMKKYGKSRQEVIDQYNKTRRKK